MFEGIKIVRQIKKLVLGSSNIPGSLVTQSEHLAKQNLYTVEEVAVMIVQIALSNNYISRTDLTPKGELLVSEEEKLTTENEQLFKE